MSHPLSHPAAVAKFLHDLANRFEHKNGVHHPVCACCGLTTNTFSIVCVTCAPRILHALGDLIEPVPMVPASRDAVLEVFASRQVARALEG
jgi:hypothetical protein